MNDMTRFIAIIH